MRTQIEELLGFVREAVGYNNIIFFLQDNLVRWCCGLFNLFFIAYTTTPLPPFTQVNGMLVGVSFYRLFEVISFVSVCLYKCVYINKVGVVQSKGRSGRKG